MKNCKIHSLHSDEILRDGKKYGVVFAEFVVVCCALGLIGSIAFVSLISATASLLCFLPAAGVISTINDKIMFMFNQGMLFSSKYNVSNIS